MFTQMITQMFTQMFTDVHTDDRCAKEICNIGILHVLSTLYSSSFENVRAM